MINTETLWVVGKVLLKERGRQSFSPLDGKVERQVSDNQIKCSPSSRKNFRKGFTLVELIVVLTIIAILAAFAVPALLGFTDGAREKKYITEAKEALASAQTMLSDAYTDNLVYIPVDMRDKALETSGLDGKSTEFVIWTEDSFRHADGTYNTYKSYAIASALYVVNGGTFVYFNNNKWTVSDSIDVIGNKKNEDLEKYTRGGDNYNAEENYITVWPSNAASVGKDTAINKKYVDGQEEPIDDEPDKRHDDSKDYDDYKPSGDNPGVRVVISAPKTINGHAPLTVSGAASVQLQLKAEGFEEKPVCSPVDNVRFVESTLKWTVSGHDGAVFDDLNRVEQFMKDTYGDQVDTTASIKVYVKGTIEERTVPVKVGFEACNPNTQTVSVTGATDGKSLNMTYRMAKESIDSATVFDTGSVQVSQENSAYVRFDNNWAEKDINNEYIMSGSGYEFTPISQVKTKVAKLAKDYVDNNISTIAANIENNQNTALEETGFKFVAAADVCKKVYVRGKLNEDKTGFLGVAKFGDNQEPMFDETFAYNELTKKIYKATINGESFSKGEEVADAAGNVKEGYSIFTGHELYIGNDDVAYTTTNINSKPFRVKFWNLYDSSFNYTISEEITSPETCRKQYNCTEEILAKLYDSTAGGEEKYGEVAEVDVTGITTKIENNDSGTSDIREYFVSLAGGNPGNINKIQYVVGGGAPAVGSIKAEKSISVTPAISEGANLKRENGKYVADVKDEDYTEYPAYTVAYSKASTEVSGKYDIFVVTEDSTGMLVEGSLKQMNSGFTSMKSNNVIEKFETSGVTDMSEMFKNCSVVTELNLGSLNTSSVAGAGMREMFYNCSAAGTINVSGFDTDQVRDLNSMFYKCSAVSELDLNSFDTSNVTDMTSMFEECTSLTNLNVVASGFKSEGNLQHVKRMFYNCKSLEGLDLRGFKTCSQIVDISEWFYHCDHMKYIDLSNFVPGELTNINGAFYSVGNYDGDVTGRGNSTTIMPDDGCSVFVTANGWNSASNIEDNKGFDYFRINLYGKVCKNSNALVKDIKYYYPDNTYETINYEMKKGDVKHLKPQSANKIYSSANQVNVGDNNRDSSKKCFYINDFSQSLPTDVRRVTLGYFNLTGSTYYTEGEWGAPEDYFSNN